MELFKIFGTIAVNNEEANNEIDETTGKASNAQSKIVESFKKIGTAVVTYFAVDKIINFGKACIDAASDANAAESQFAQVFGKVEGSARDSLSKIASDAGIAENRMKASFTKIAAFAKTTGMDTEDALALSERAMVAVADSAAFYDRTLEETTESLQSFLKGNFENDAALGLSCTETTRNAAANKLYGKSFQDLSESQKQLTLLKMVEDANKLSGAIGQSARESATWTNQVGNLKQSWTDFMAMVGGEFLEPAIGAVMKATEGIQKLGDVTTNIFEFWREIVTPAIRTVGSAFNNVVTAMNPVIQAFINLMPESVTAASAMDIIRAACYLLEGILLAIADRLNAVSQWITEHTPQIIAVVNGLWEAVKFIWDTIGVPIFDAIMFAVETVAGIFSQKMPEIKAFVSQCFEDIQQLWVMHLKPCFDAIGAFIKNILAPTFNTVFNDVIAWAVKTAFDFITSCWNDVLKPVLTGIIDFLTGVFTGNWKQAWEGLLSIVKGIFNGVISAIETMVNSAIDALNKLIKSANKIANKIPGVNINIPTIDEIELPRLEKGGILEKGQIGFLEGTGAEAVVPLDQNRAWISALAKDMEAEGFGGNSQQTQRIIELLEMLIDMMPETMKEAFASMKFDVNNREFARLVKAVN